MQRRARILVLTSSLMLLTSVGIALAAPSTRHNPRQESLSGSSADADSDDQDAIKLGDITSGACAFRDGRLNLRTDGTGRFRGHILQLEDGERTAVISLKMITNGLKFHLIEVKGPRMSGRTLVPGFSVDAEFKYDKTEFREGSNASLGLVCSVVEPNPTLTRDAR